MEVEKIGFVPGTNFLVARVLPEPERKERGVLLPNSAHSSQQRAVVISVGSYEKSHPYEPGDVIMLDYYSGKEINVDGVPYCLVKAEEVLGRFL